MAETCHYVDEAGECERVAREQCEACGIPACGQHMNNVGKWGAPRMLCDECAGREDEEE